LEFLAQSNELVALDKEMGFLQFAVFVKVGVLVASSIDDFVY
jgi:hypothetical protein